MSFVSCCVNTNKSGTNGTCGIECVEDGWIGFLEESQRDCVSKPSGWSLRQPWVVTAGFSERFSNSSSPSRSTSIIDSRRDCNAPTSVGASLPKTSRAPSCASSSLPFNSLSKRSIRVIPASKFPCVRSMTDPKEPIPQIESFALCPSQPESTTAFAAVYCAGVKSLFS